MDEHNNSKADFHRKIDLETSTKFLHRTENEFGDVVIVQHQSTKQQYILKEKNFPDKFSFLEELNKAKNRRNLVHSNILKFVDFSTLTKIDKVEQSFRIRLFFEHIGHNLAREIRSRISEQVDFALEEITYLIYDTIAACGYLQGLNINHGDISPEIILRTDDGHFVLGDKLKNKTKFPQNLIDRFIRGEKLYLSPELYSMIRSRNSEGIERMNYFTNDVFILGLCILEAGVCQDVTTIFRKNSPFVDQDILAEFLTCFEMRYGQHSLPSLVLAKMLEIDPLKRPDFLVLKTALPSYKDMIIFFKENKDTGNMNSEANSTTKPSRSFNNVDEVGQLNSKKPVGDFLKVFNEFPPPRKPTIFATEKININNSSLSSNAQINPAEFFHPENSERHVSLTGYRLNEATSAQLASRLENRPPGKASPQNEANNIGQPRRILASEKEGHLMSGQNFNPQQQYSGQVNPALQDRFVHEQINHQHQTDFAKKKGNNFQDERTSQPSSYNNPNAKTEEMDFFNFAPKYNPQTQKLPNRSDSSNVIGSKNQSQFRNDGFNPQKNGPPPNNILHHAGPHNSVPGKSYPPMPHSQQMPQKFNPSQLFKPNTESNPSQIQMSNVQRPNPHSQLPPQGMHRELGNRQSEPQLYFQGGQGVTGQNRPQFTQNPNKIESARGTPVNAFGLPQFEQKTSVQKSIVEFDNKNGKDKKNGQYQIF